MKQPKMKMPMTLSAKQLVYPYLVKYFAKHGVSPTLQEVAVEMKKTKQWVKFCLQILEKEKYIKVKRYGFRGITLKR